jgi:hypothetical protein
MARFNPFLSTLVLLFAAFLSLASAWDINNENDRERCQAYSQNPLEGCDQERTVFVDVVSPQSKFKTVQSGKTHRNRKPTSSSHKEIKRWHLYPIILVSYFELTTRTRG